MPTVSIVPASTAHFHRRINELVGIHLAAMNYPASFTQQRRSLWLSTMMHTDFRCHLALLHPDTQEPDLLDETHRSIGVCFSFQGSEHTWWNQQVARGLRHSGHSPQRIATLLSNYAELSEVHVTPDMQGKGIGHALLSTHLATIQQPTVMLSTPEVPGENNGAWKLYRRIGFHDILRNFYFPSDARPFAILAKKL